MLEPMCKLTSSAGACVVRLVRLARLVCSVRPVSSAASRFLHCRLRPSCPHRPWRPSHAAPLACISFIVRRRPFRSSSSLVSCKLCRWLPSGFASSSVRLVRLAQLAVSPVVVRHFRLVRRPSHASLYIGCRANSTKVVHNLLSFGPVYFVSSVSSVSSVWSIARVARVVRRDRCPSRSRAPPPPPSPVAVAW